MRRLASVLVASSKRSDKSDAPSPPSSTDDPSRHRLVPKKSRVFASLSRKHLSSIDPPSLPSLVASDLANSSSSSSSGSTTLRTPDDDGLPRTSSKKGSWKSWLGGKNAPVGDHPEEPHPLPWQSSRSALHLLKPGSNEADDASSQFDDSYVNVDDIPSQSHSVQQATTARANARIMITNSLVHEPTSPPLLQLSDAISFPRSCRNSRRLHRRETLESEMHKKALIGRLDRLSPPAELSILPLASKQITGKPRVHRNLQDDEFPSADAVSLHSDGLANWVSRPCFEDRLQLWTRSDSGEIIRTRISGSNVGVAALEFSESLELLAGTLPESDEDVGTLEPTLPSLTFNFDSPATHIKELGSELVSSQRKDSPTKRPPSQSSFASLSLPKVPSPERQPDGSTASGSAATNGAVPKRGVRFADDDGKDDQIPLGYVLRIRKNKEQKARFLREERERRERATQLPVENHQASIPLAENRASKAAAPRQLPQRPLISLNEPLKPRQPATAAQVVSEERRLCQEFERIEMEKLRRSRESSRKQAEEWERTYAEEFRATRARREASRAGRPLESAFLAPRVADRDRSASRDSMHASLGRSGMAHKYTPELVFSPVLPQDGSPSSSMPATPGSQYSLSRPPSLYSAHTASSEDVRGRDGKRVSRRMSVVSDSGKGMTLHPPYDPRASFSPYTWAGVPVPVIPPVPPMPVTPMVNGMPFYGMDMPLLPPTPPFMMNQFGARSHSYTGLGGQYFPHQTLTPLPKNYSSERVDTSSRNSSPHSSGSHQRRSSSDEATRMAKTSGSNDVRGSRTSVFMNVPPSQSNPKRSSWLPADHNSTKKSSLRPVTGVGSTGAPAPVRRRTAAS